jgi:hypothetical protein
MSLLKDVQKAQNPTKVLEVRFDEILAIDIEDFIALLEDSFFRVQPHMRRRLMLLALNSGPETSEAIVGLIEGQVKPFTI